MKMRKLLVGTAVLLMAAFATGKLQAAVQIDSFDSTANWTASSGTLTVDGSVKVEGTGSMKIATVGWDNWVVYNPSPGLNLSGQNALTCWIKANYIEPNSSLNIFYVGMWNGSGQHIYYYPGVKPTTTNWAKNTWKLSSFTQDAGSPPFDLTNITQISILCNTWDHNQPGAYLWVDDLRAEKDPQQQLDSFDNIAAEGWSINYPSIGGSMVQDTNTYHEGTGSMRVDFPADQQYWDNWVKRDVNWNLNVGNDFQLTFWAKVTSIMTTGAERIANITLYDKNGKATRFNSLETTYAENTDWYKVSCPLSQFTPDNIAVDMNNITSIHIKFSTYPTQDPAGSSVWIDDLELGTVPILPPLSLAFVMNAQKVTTPPTIDGNTADWANLTDSDWTDFDLAAVPPQGNGGNLHVKYQMAWDTNYLYILVQEVPGDGDAKEADGLSGLTGLNDGAGGDVYYDNLALYFDFTKTHSPGSGADIALWLFCGLHSNPVRNDMMMAWTNGNWGPHDPAAITNGACATSGTLGNRVFEGKIKWSDLDADIQSARLPAGGLANAIKPGYVFGCDPRLNDLEGQWAASTEKGSAWMNGYLWGPYPTGRDAYSTNVRLVCKAADLNGDCNVNFDDFAILAAQWLKTGCTNQNVYCNGADIVMDNAVNMTDLKKFAEEWLK